MTCANPLVIDQTGNVLTLSNTNTTPMTVTVNPAISGFPVTIAPSGSQIATVDTPDAPGTYCYDFGYSCETDAVKEVTNLQRQFPGFGGEALNDSLVNSVYFITTLNPTGPGSISAAPSNAYIVPLVAGNITTSSSISMAQNNIRVLGQLAPGHLAIDGTTTVQPRPLLSIDGSNVLFEFLSLRSGDAPSGNSSHAPFDVIDGNVGIVISNVSAHYGGDDSGSVWNPGTSDVTFYRILAAHAANSGPGGSGANPNYGLMAGGSSNRTTMFQNVMQTTGRSPLFQTVREGQAVNNITYGSGGTSQILAVTTGQTGGLQGGTMDINFHDNLDIRPNGNASQIWMGEAAGWTLETYRNNHQWRNCAGVYTNVGTTGLANQGTFIASPHSMPALPVITDLAQLEATLLPKVGNYLCRDAIDDDAISIINSCVVNPIEITASNYFADPWPVGPSKPALTIWDQSSPDGISDAAKVACGIDPATNLLSPNDGRWEAVVDFHTNGLLSASVE